MTVASYVPYWPPTRHTTGFDSRLCLNPPSPTVEMEERRKTKDAMMRGEGTIFARGIVVVVVVVAAAKDFAKKNSH